MITSFWILWIPHYRKDSVIFCYVDVLLTDVCARDLLRNSQNIYNCNFEENSEGCCFRNCPGTTSLWFSTALLNRWLSVLTRSEISNHCNPLWIFFHFRWFPCRFVASFFNFKGFILIYLIVDPTYLTWNLFVHFFCNDKEEATRNCYTLTCRFHE